VHIGDGEFTDIERKAELGGNIHAKGMMIMQAFLMSELELEQQIPFSASLTFEQSYSEVDGDSASMAELCALISALAKCRLIRTSRLPVPSISLVALSRSAV
jgi:Lon-like ATP-dependent protease